MSKPTNNLHDLLPRAGLIIDNHSPVTSRAQRDKLVLNKLQHASIVGRAFFKRNQYRDALNTELAAMFAIAARDEKRAKLTKATDNNENTDGDDDEDDEGGYLDFVDAVKEDVAWAQDLSSSVFLDFFTRLLGARVAWVDKPREPFDEKDHSTTAQAAQVLLNLEPGL